MKIYNNLEKDSNVRIREIAEIISDLRDPLTASQPFQPNSKPVTDNEDPKETSKRKAEEDEEEEMDVASIASTAKDREEVAKKAQTEARKNEEALRKKRVR
jgi:hypothetical protein